MINSQLAHNAYIRPQPIGGKKESVDIVKPRETTIVGNYRRIKRSFLAEKQLT